MGDTGKGGQLALVFFYSIWASIFGNGEKYLANTKENKKTNLT